MGSFQSFAAIVFGLFAATSCTFKQIEADVYSPACMCVHGITVALRTQSDLAAAGVRANLSTFSASCYYSTTCQPASLYQAGLRQPFGRIGHNAESGTGLVVVLQLAMSLLAGNALHVVCCLLRCL